MNFRKTLPLAMAMLAFQALPLAAAQDQTPAALPGTVPLYRVTLVKGSARAIKYQNLAYVAKIDLKGTALCPAAVGEASVKSLNGAIQVTVKVNHLPQASTFGGEFLTYVLWGISPEGRATNLGEIVLKHGKATVKVTERLQTFGLVVTAEPYFAVSQPSDVVVMDNDLSPELKGKIELVDTKYELLKRGQYAQNLDSPAAMAMDSKTPFEVYQARNAVRIARATGAAAYAPEAYGKAADYLQRAETEDASKAKVVMAREAVQRAEDARLIAVQKQDSEQTILDEKLAKARLDKARDEAAATAAANDRLKAKLDESRRETAAAGASEDAALKAARLAEAENEGLRDRLRVQLNAILQTRATARGLIVNMSGVLFENGKSALVPAAREKLAKIAGILSTHKGLRIEADGFTDSVGSEESNQRLSEQRAQSARDYLVAQGVAADHISVKGFGEANPIASNETSAGRQENRRVELVVSGAGITAAKAAGM